MIKYRPVSDPDVCHSIWIRVREVFVQDGYDHLVVWTDTMVACGAIVAVHICFILLSCTSVIPMYRLVQTATSYQGLLLQILPQHLLLFLHFL